MTEQKGRLSTSPAPLVQPPDYRIVLKDGSEYLVECKNGAVVRKIMGYGHIPQKHAAAINRFHEEALNPYLNFHRPCYFAVDTVDARGRIRKTYPAEQIMTPWERLRSIPDFEKLQDMRRNLFASFRRKRA